ncbi:MAG: Gfo/Idh/MocA family protein [Acidimicrobiales bacterium]
MSDALRLGFIGTGVIASAHSLALRGLVKSGLIEAEVAAVFDTDQARCNRFAERSGAVAASSAAEVVDRCDAVYVCTSTAGHLDAVRAAASGGRPIFCEKPLARDLTESLSLAAVAAEAGVPVQVGLVLRTAPVFRQLAAIIASGEFGRPMAALWRDDQFFPIQGHYGSTWRRDVEQAGAGALLEHSIHDVDIMRACFGAVQSVTATTAGIAGYAGIEDSASALLRLAGVPAVSLVSVWHQVMTRPSTRRVEVACERGFLVLEDDFNGPISVQTDDGVELRECPAPDWVMDVPVPSGSVGLAVRPYVEENWAFVTAIVAGTRPSPGLEEAIAAHRVVDACYRSAAAAGAVMAGPW